MSRHLLEGAATLAQGESRLYRIDGGKYMVYRLSDGVYATSAKCTHLFKSLEKGEIVADKNIRCPLHRAEFDIRTGEVDIWACFPPGIVNVINAVRPEQNLGCYPVEEESGDYYLVL